MAEVEASVFGMPLSLVIWVVEVSAEGHLPVEVALVEVVVLAAASAVAVLEVVVPQAAGNCAPHSN
ncbi:MAG: H+/Cl- antiporter ClcA [Sediminicola sp.]